MKNLLIGFLAVIIAFGGGYMLKPQIAQVGGFGDIAELRTGGTFTNASVGNSTSSNILAANSARLFNLFCNTALATSSQVWLAFGANAASSSAVLIPNNSCWPSNPFVIIKQAVNATANTTTTISIVHY